MVSSLGFVNTSLVLLANIMLTSNTVWSIKMNSHIQLHTRCVARKRRRHKISKILHKIPFFTTFHAKQSLLFCCSIYTSWLNVCDQHFLFLFIPWINGTFTIKLERKNMCPTININLNWVPIWLLSTDILLHITFWTSSKFQPPPWFLRPVTPECNFDQKTWRIPSGGPSSTCIHKESIASQ